MQRTKLQNLVWMGHRTLALDGKFIKRVRNMTTVQKAEFLFKKYLVLGKHLVTPLKLGVSKISLQGKDLFYNSAYASFAGLQAILSEHLFWFCELPLGDAPVILDVGANVGYIPFAIKQCYPMAKIYSFEPIPHTYDVLKKNVAGLTDVHTFNIALGSENKTIEFDVDIDQTALASLRDASQTDPKAVKIAVQLSTLDTFMREHPEITKIDILKIDVEGYEINVLEGALETLKKVRYLHIEFNARDYVFSDLMTLLEKSGRKVQLLYVRNFDNIMDSKFNDGDMLFELI